MNYSRKKGAISIPIAFVGSILLVSATGFSAYYGTVNAQNEKVAEVKLALTQDINEVRIEVASEKQNTQNLEKRLDRFEGKLDALLVNQGINPSKIQ